MSTPTIQTHDIVLSNGTTTLGLIAVKDKNKLKLERGFRDTYAAQQFTELSPGAFKVEDRLFWEQDSWTAGFGKQKYSANRYKQSFGADASFPGIIVPGPVAVATTKDTPTYASTATIANGGFEVGDMSSWTVVTQGTTASWAAQGGTVQTGAWAASVSTVWDTVYPEIKQKLTAPDCSLFSGISLTLSAFGRRAGGAGTMTVYLKDGSGTTIDSATVTMVDTGWTEATFTHVFTDGWPELWVHVRFTGTAGTPIYYLDDVTRTISGSIGTAADTGTIVKLIDFNLAHYAVSETGVWKRTTNNWARVTGSPDAITDAETDGTNLYLARGSSKNYWYMSTAEAFTRNTGTAQSSKVQRLRWAGGAMYSTYDPVTVYKYNNLATGAAPVSFTVGITGYNFTALVQHLELLHILKENHHAYISAAAAVVPNVSPQLSSLYNANTGKNAISFNGNLYIPAGAQGMLEYDDGGLASVAPSHYVERLADFSGQVVATAFDDEWLYVVLDNTAKIEILKGRRETNFAWHPFFEDTYATVSYAMVSSITAKRLWYGGGTALPKYIPLPTKYSDPINDTTLSFKSAVTFELPWITLGLPNVSKTFSSCTLDSQSLSTGHQTVKVEYKKLGDASWTELGGAGNGTYGTAATGTEEKFFETGTSSVKSNAILLRLTFTSDDTTKGFGISRVFLSTIANPVRIYEFIATVEVKTNNVNRENKPDTEMTYDFVMSTLMGWNATHPLTLTWPDGTGDGQSYTVKFAEGYPRELPVSLDPNSLEGHRAFVELKFVETRTS